jgi:8-oxo-dGTP diphosphatase
MSELPANASPRRPLPRLGSAAIVVDEAGRILLGIRSQPPLEGHWVLPGGGVKPFETLATAVEREVLEETGLVVKAQEQLGVWEIVEPPDEHRVIVYTRAEVVAGHLAAGGDLSEPRFWDREQLPSLKLTPLVFDVLQHLGWLDVTFATSPHARRAA